MKKCFNIQFCYFLVVGILPFSFFSQISSSTQSTNSLEFSKKTLPIFKNKDDLEIESNKEQEEENSLQNDESAGGAAESTEQQESKEFETDQQKEGADVNPESATSQEETESTNEFGEDYISKESSDDTEKFEQTEDSAFVGVGWKKSFMEFVDEAKRINNEIKNIIDELRVMRDEKYNEFYTKIDEPLDNLFQKVNFEYGVIFEQFELKKLERFKLYKKSWDELKSRVENLDNLESESFKILHQLNNKLSEAMQESIKARENESKMLGETNKEALLQILNNIKGSYKKIKNIQKQDIESKILKSFSKNLETIKNFIASIKKDLKGLEQKGKTFELPMKNVKKIFKSQKNVTKEKIKKKNYIFKTSVRFIAFVVTIIKQTVDWFINIVDKIYNWIINKKEKIEKVSDPLVEKTDIEIKRLKKNMKELEKEKKEIIKKSKKLENIKENHISQIKEKLLLAKEEDIKKEVLALPKEIISDLQKVAKPKWRVVIEYLFGKLLDIINFLVDKTKKIFGAFYNLFAKEKWEKFIKDVKKRVKKIEQKKINKNIQRSEVETDDMNNLESFPEQMGPVSKGGKEGDIPLISTE